MRQDIRIPDGAADEEDRVPVEATAVGKVKGNRIPVKGKEGARARARASQTT